LKQQGRCSCKGFIILKVSSAHAYLSKVYCTIVQQNLEWHIGSTHGSGVRGPGFDSHPNPDGFI